jgi:lauroyl/myristoyl acyltransferase
MVTGHFGAVEFLPLSLAVNNFPVTMIVCFKTPQLKAALKSRCRHVPITLLDAKNDRGVIFNAFKALKRNQILITECDEFDAWNVNGKQQTSFLGLRTPVDRSLDMLQRRYRSPAIMSLVQRESSRRFALNFHDLQESSRQKAASGVASESLMVLESYIKQTPEQWYQWKDVSHLPGVEPYEVPATAPRIDTRRPLPLTNPVLQPHRA